MKRFLLTVSLLCGFYGNLTFGRGGCEEIFQSNINKQRTLSQNHLSQNNKKTLASVDIPLVDKLLFKKELVREIKIKSHLKEILESYYRNRWISEGDKEFFKRELGIPVIQKLENYHRNLLIETLKHKQRTVAIKDGFLHTKVSRTFGETFQSLKGDQKGLLLVLMYHLGFRNFSDLDLKQLNFSKLSSLENIDRWLYLGEIDFRRSDLRGAIFGNSETTLSFMYAKFEGALTKGVAVWDSTSFSREVAWKFEVLRPNVEKIMEKMFKKSPTFKEPSKEEIYQRFFGRSKRFLELDKKFFERELGSPLLGKLNYHYDNFIAEKLVYYYDIAVKEGLKDNYLFLRNALSMRVHMGLVNAKVSETFGETFQSLKGDQKGLLLIWMYHLGFRNFSDLDLRELNFSRLSSLEKIGEWVRSLEGVTLERANLEGADLRGMNLKWTNLEWATYDRNTQMDISPIRRMMRGMSAGVLDPYFPQE